MWEISIILIVIFTNDHSKNILHDDSSIDSLDKLLSYDLYVELWNIC